MDGAVVVGNADARVGDAFGADAVREAEVLEQLDGAVLDDARADAALGIGAVAAFEDGCGDSRLRELVGEQHPGRACADDRNGSSHGVVLPGRGGVGHRRNGLKLG